MKLIEGVIDTVMEYLQDNIAAKIAIVDAEYADFPLEEIKAWYMAEVKEVPEYPSIFVLGERSEVREEGDNYVRALHLVTILVIAIDQDTEQLRRKLYRYTRVISDLLRDSRASTDYVTTIVSFEYSPMFARGESEFIADARLVVEFVVYET